MTNPDMKTSSSSSIGKTRSKTDINTFQLIKDDMSPFLGEEKNSMLDISEATAMMLISHYNIQDVDIVNTAFMTMVDPDNYNRKTSFTNKFGSIKPALNELQPFKILFSEANMSELYAKDNIKALFSNLEKLDKVSNAALQSLILVFAISITKKKPEGLKMKVPVGTLQGLSKAEIKKRLSFLLTISQVLFHKSKTFDLADDKKVSKMNRDLTKIVMEF